MSNLMGGYAMIDCEGLVLTSQTSQTKTGLYAKVKTALESGKMILAENCVYNTSKSSPIPVMVIDEAGTLICTNSILQIRIASDDSVTIVSLLDGQAKKK